MKMTAFRLSAQILATLFLAALAFAGVPKTITYQGYLKNGAGSPVTAIDPKQPMGFALYSTASGTISLWNESQDVKVDKGIYSVELGTTNPITLPFDTRYYLGITVSPDTVEMTPRQALTAVPYAMNAASADRLTLLCSQGDFLNCYSGDMTTMGKGLCRAGNRICLPTRDRFSDVCAGEIVPVQEICDNLDNDCDGTIDNKIAPRSCYTGPAGTLECRHLHWGPTDLLCRSVG